MNDITIKKEGEGKTLMFVLGMGDSFYASGVGWVKGNDIISLTRTERILINKLIKSLNIPVPRQKLAREIFCNFNTEENNLIENSTYKGIERERIVDVNINRLRKKIEKNPKSPRFLKTVRSVGYMLVPD